MSASRSLTFLSNVAVSLGSGVPLASIPDVRDADASARLSAEGLATVCIAADGPADLAAASIAGALDGGDRPDLHTLATTTCWPEVADVTARAGLSTVPMIGVTRNACANLLPALRVARSVLAAEEDTATVLVTLLDAVRDGPRMLAGGIGVLSDGAASCLVTSERPPSGWVIAGAEVANDFRLERDDGADPVRSAEVAHSMGREIRAALERLAAGSGVTLNGYDVVLMNNYTGSTLAAFAKLIDAPMERLYDATRSDVSHCFSADPLIDLAAMESSAPPAGTRVFALVCGPGVWGMLALERL
jgi:3-oxoacyl-[acyl-carrier-protein] synthase-3